MMYPNAHIHHKIHQTQVQRSVEAAEKGRILHEAGIDQRGFLERVACKLLCGIGTALVKFGRRLQKFDLSAAAPATRRSAPSF